MNTLRKVSLVVLGVVLFLVLLSANLAVTADRTVLDAEFAKETADEAGVYEALVEEVSPDEGAADGAGDGPLGQSEAGLFQAALTEEYVRSQAETNIDRVYGYLHGKRDELRIVIDTEPLKENVLEEVESSIGEVDLGELGVPHGEEIESMAADESAFERQRASFREEQKERIQRETERELSDEELERRLDERIEEIRQELYDELDAQIEESGVEPAMEEPVRELGEARIDALTGAATHGEFVERVDAARADLRDALIETFETGLDEEIPDSQDVTEGMDEGTTEGLEMARQGVQVLSALALAFPLGALALAGLVGWLAPPSVASIEVGVVSTLAGLLGVAAGRVVPGQVESIVASEASDPAADVALAVVDGITGTLLTQSVLLLAIGVGLVAVGIAIRRGVILGDVTGASTADATGDDTESTEGGSASVERGSATGPETAEEAETDAERTDDSASGEEEAASTGGSEDDPTGS